MKYTDASSVISLAQNLVSDAKSIAQYTEDLRGELKRLQGTFLDDGIQEVNGYVGNISEKLNEVQESVGVVANQLVQYAEILLKGKG